MIHVVWEFIVRETALDDFEQAYGPRGDWQRLFARYSGFNGTTLLRDTANPRRYLTVDSWETPADRERMLVEAAEQYAALDAAFGKWTESEAEVGIFESRLKPLPQ
ncbi:MAG TPA: antibiotic biosynthesis monooxygenase [Gammaproteobacteria bacterium]|jgi:heme-degrading monooxygenase HmoA